MASKAESAKLKAEREQLLEEYVSVRDTIRRREKRMKERGYIIDKSYVPLTKTELLKNKITLPQLRSKVKKLKAITPEISYKSAHYVSPETGEVISGREQRRIERSIAAKKGTGIKETDPEKRSEILFERGRELRGLRKAREELEKGIEEILERVEPEIDEISGYNDESEREAEIEKEKKYYPKEVSQSYETDIPIEQIRKGPKFAKQGVSGFYSVVDTISRLIANNYYLINGGFKRRKRNGQYYIVPFDTEPHKDKLLSLWSDVVEKYSDDENSMAFLIDYVYAHQEKIAELLSDVQHAQYEAEYQGYFVELANILSIEGMDVEESKAFYDDDEEIYL